MEDAKGPAPSGFTIVETAVTAAIVAVVLTATIGVLARYTETDIRTQKFLRAQHLAQAEVDEVLARHSVENSLVSDTLNRARYYPMEEEDMGYIVSQYFFHNFPLDHPPGTTFNHAEPGSIDRNNFESLFEANQGRTSTGAPTTAATGAYTLRYQLLGIEAGISSDELSSLIDLTANPILAIPPTGLYNNHFWVPGTYNTNSTMPKGTKVYNPLIGDSSPSVTLSGALWLNNVRRFKMPYDGYDHFVSKVLIVRVYDRQEPRREIGHAYGVLTGRVQL